LGSGDADPQQIVEMHEPDRAVVVIDDDQRPDAVLVEQRQRAVASTLAFTVFGDRPS
jgi:hypothetical protein